MGKCESRESRERNRLKKLFREDPKCHWCRQETVMLKLPKHAPKPPTNMATIDHLFSRYHPLRQSRNSEVERTVLACWQCNNDRSRHETASIPKDVLSERCGNKLSNFKALKSGNKLHKRFSNGRLGEDAYNIIRSCDSAPLTSDIPGSLAFYLTGLLNGNKDIPKEVRHHLLMIYWIGLESPILYQPRHLKEEKERLFLETSFTGDESTV